MTRRPELMGRVAVMLIIIFVAPFLVLMLDPARASAALLVTHFDTVILGVLTIAVALLALNSYLGIEERVRRRMDEEAEAIKQAQRDYFRWWMDLTASREDPARFERFVERIVQRENVYQFFQSDMQDAFYSLNASPGQLTPTTAGLLVNFLTDHPDLYRDRRWKFYLHMALQNPHGWAQARSDLAVLSPQIQPDREWVEAAIPWLFGLWHEEAPDDYQRELSALVYALAGHFNLTNRIVDAITSLCQQPYSDNAVNWNDDMGVSGQMQWCVRDGKSGALMQWTAHYQDVFRSSFNGHIEISGNSLDLRQRIFEDLTQRNSDGWLKLYRENLDTFRVIALWVPEAIQTRDEFHYGLVVVQRHSTIPLGNGSHPFLTDYLHHLKERQLQVLAVEKIPSKNDVHS